MERRPVLVVVAGPNGSGKTTLAKIMRARKWFRDFTYINPDQIAQEQFGGWNTPGAAEQAALRSALVLRRALQEKRNVLLETVFASSGPDILKRARDAGYSTRLYFVGTVDPAINVARVADRYQRGGHSVPTELVVSRYRSAMAALPEAVAIAERARLFDNSIDDAPMTALLRMSNGVIDRQFVERLPSWAEVPLRRAGLDGNGETPER